MRGKEREKLCKWRKTGWNACRVIFLNSGLIKNLRMIDAFVIVVWCRFSTCGAGDDVHQFDRSSTRSSAHHHLPLRPHGQQELNDHRPRLRLLHLV